VCLLSFLSIGHTFTEEHASGKVTTYYRGEISDRELLFGSLNFDAIYKSHSNTKMVLFANSILVERGALNDPKFVLVRLRLGFGFCKKISAALFNIQTNEITVDTTNKWQDNIFKYMKENNLVPNLSLKGPDIDKLILAGNDLYKHTMITGTL